MKGNINCKIELCIRESRVRGLCTNHYIVLSKKVASQELTWLQLEQYGMAVPAKHKGLAQVHLDKVRAALLGGKSK